MKDHPDLEALERGELAAEPAAEAEAHLAECEACRRERAWLRAERDLFAGRREGAGAPPAALWRGVEERVARRRRGTGRLALVAVALSAAAVIVVTVWPRGGEQDPVAVKAPDAALPPAPAAPAPAGDLEAALDRAETAYLQAVAELEADYRARRATLDPALAQRLDARFAAVHRTLDEARAQAGDDVESRMRALHAYRQVVHGLQAEANFIAEERP
jgi:hypothetical protein